MGKWCFRRHAQRRISLDSSRFGYFSQLQRWTPLVFESARRCQAYFEKSACRGLLALPIAARSRLRVGCATPLRAGQEKHRSPVDPRSYNATARHVKNCRGCENFYGLGGGVGRGLGLGPDLGVGVGLGVDVAVAVAVGVAVGVGVGVPPLGVTHTSSR